VNPYQKKNAQQGFVTTWFALMLPLLLAVVAVVGAGFLVMRADAETKHLCRVGVLGTQEKIATSLSELIALNPQAQALRARRQAAEAAIRSGEPHAVAAGTAALAETNVEQMALAALQKKLIAGAQLLGTKTPLKIRGDVERALSSAQNRVQLESGADLTTPSRSASFMGHVAMNLPFFDVRPTPAGDLTPDYQPAENFTQEQLILLSWSVDATSLLPKWSQTVGDLAQVTLKLRGTCGASIEKENNQWIAKLQADKSSSN
jgi:hypothetical protein